MRIRLVARNPLLQMIQPSLKLAVADQVVAEHHMPLGAHILVVLLLGQAQDLFGKVDALLIFAPVAVISGQGPQNGK